MEPTRRALDELIRGERGLDLACRTVAAARSDPLAASLESLARAHRRAAHQLEACRPTALSTPFLGLSQRALAFLAALRGASGAVAWLLAREHAQLRRYTGQLALLDLPTRRTIQRDLLPDTLAQLARVELLRADDDPT